MDHVGTYLELDRRRRLTFEFRRVGYSTEANRVRVEIVAPDGGAS